MTKKDYMCLPKERLAELLVERDNAPSFIPYFQIYKPHCWEPGGLCTNPMRDCINCPRMTAMEMYNTTCGTSTGTLHGNTSATDGKEHNPSFTD